jgi:tetratricopeptide (TPR) repeat protein
MGLLTLGGGGIGLHFLQPQLSPLCLIQHCEQKTKTVTVLLAEFDGVDAKNYRVTERILQNLQHANKNYPTVKILPLKQAITQQEGQDKARELGKNKNADIVIWGSYGKTQEKAAVSVNFEILSAAKDYIDVGKQVQGEPRNMAVASLESFEIQVNLAEELKYLTLVTLGVSAYAADDWDNAIKQLTVALSEAKPNKAALDPATIYFYRGTAYYNQKEYDRAIEDYNQVLVLNPKYAVAFYNRGNAYGNKGEYDRAIADYNQALLLNPKFAEAFNNRGIAYSDRKEYDRAIADYNQALLLNPKDAVAFNNRGNAYNNKKEYDRAIADYNQALLLNPKYAEAFNNRGNAYSDRKEYDRAIADYNQALLLNPKYAEAFNNRGNAYNNKKEYDRAIADYNQALLLNPKYAEFFYNRGMAYELKGDKVKAIESYRQALAVAQDPQVKEFAQRKLKKLEGK